MKDISRVRQILQGAKEVRKRGIPRKEEFIKGFGLPIPRSQGGEAKKRKSVLNHSSGEMGEEEGGGKC